LLVAGPYSNLFVPQEPSTTISESNFSGFRPTSYFQTSLPLFASSATRKPRPVLPGYEAVPANICSRVPPPKTTLPPAMICEAIRGEAPLLDELAYFAGAQRLLGGIKPPTGNVGVIPRPVGGRDGGACLCACRRVARDEQQCVQCEEGDALK